MLGNELLLLLRKLALFIYLFSLRFLSGILTFAMQIYSEEVFREQNHPSLIVANFVPNWGAVNRSKKKQKNKNPQPCPKSTGLKETQMSLAVSVLPGEPEG